MEPERHDSQDDQDGTRFWREEREEGAVYHAYLKRVTYLSQARLEDETAREFSHLMWETQKVRVIQAGTLYRLVEALASHCRGELDSSHMNVLLSTFRTFATPAQLLDAIIHRYQTLRSQCKEEKSELCEQQQKTFRCVLSVWLDKYPEDFREPPDFACLRLVESFAREVIPDSDLAARAQQRMNSFQKEMEEKDETIQFRFSICDEVDHMMEVPKPLSFNDITPRMCAEQLTLRDAELFRKVVPHHCLGSVWGRRDKKGGGKEEACPSVQATVEQFNRVSLRVIASVLRQRDIKTSSRVKILVKWISIAQELRELKNFSSLRAILSGLQSHPVYRLRKCWSAVSKDTVVLFEELSDIFSGDNNQLNSRELLMKEATAKFPDLESQNKTLKRKNLQKRRSWIDNGTVQGTVPYLGTFLTDLTMLDTAVPDVTEDGLINFDKRRREFQVLAQLRLLQSAAQIYTLHFEPRFWVWFDSLRVFSETESHEMSCAIEPPSESVAKIKKKSASFALRARSELKAGASVLRYYSCLGHKPAKYEGTSSAARLGLFCGSEGRNSISSIPDTIAASIGPLMSHSSSTSSVLSSDSDTQQSAFRTSDTCIIRVSLHAAQDSSDVKTHVYKSIMLNNTDHTNTVIEKVLEKYTVEDKADSYCLLQILPDGELLIPERANVFYALNNSVDLNFVVRHRSQQDSMKDKKKGKRRMKKLSL